MADQETFDFLRDSLTEAHRKTIAGREAEVRRKVKAMLAQPGFQQFCSHGHAANTAGGIIRVWVEQFWRVSRSRDGRCLLGQRCWEIISHALNYTPMELYPHAAANMAVWRPVGSGNASADKQFWDIEYLSGAARPVLVQVSLIPLFESAGNEKPIEDFAKWLGFAGGKPHHHLHPVTLEAAFGAESFTVRRTTAKAALLTISGGAKRYSITLSQAPSWVTISDTSLQMSPGVDVAPGDYSATITVNDATGQSVEIVLAITVTTD